MTFSCLTLGCKTNQTESDRLAEQLTSNGHIQVPWGEPAQAIIINTCSVTATGDRKCRAAINRARREHPNAVIAAHGCMAQGIAEKPPNIDVLGGTGDRTKFITELENAAMLRYKETERSMGAPYNAHNSQLSKTRAFIKIQDGCSNSCSYCIIPSLRGASRSISLDDIFLDAKKHADKGVKEMVLTGIEISAYDGGLAPFAAALAAAFPDVRFRLGSLDPSCVTAEFTETLSKHKNICPHFHLALQSGCGKTLAAMNRHYDINRAEEAIKLLRRSFDCTLGCDLIVGFPGESEADFQESLDFVACQEFTFTHIFPYSVRPGTVAADMPDQLSRAVKQERARRAAELQKKLFKKSAEKQSILSVLFETERDGESFGHSKNYFEVAVKETGLHNEVKHVKINGVKGKILFGGLL